MSHLNSRVVILLSMLRLAGVRGNAKVRLPERGHIETSMRDGTILTTTAQGSSAEAGLGSEGLSGGYSSAPVFFSNSTISGVDLTVPVFSVGVVFLVLLWLRVL